MPRIGEKQAKSTEGEDGRNGDDNEQVVPDRAGGLSRLC